jgi:thymidylate synthase (FAD)
MRLIFEPRVYLLNRQTINDQGLDDFLADHSLSGWETDTEVGANKTIEVSGRLCYMSFAKPRPGGNDTYIKHIKEVGHGSVLEHSVWSVIITDVSRSLTHELVRHRAGVGYSQLSQRYVDESVAEYVVPPDLQDEVRVAHKFLLEVNGLHPEVEWTMEHVSRALDSGFVNQEILAGLVWLRSVRQNTEDYRHLANYLHYEKIGPRVLDEVSKKDGRDLKTIGGPSYIDMNLKPDERTTVRKAARGAARSVLPNATETKIVVTANARAWRHMIEMRGAAPAETEIRRLYHKIWRLLIVESVTLFGDYVWSMAPDGTPLDVTTPYRKV